MLNPASFSPAIADQQATYRALWRWHFYAALFVMPFLLVLAITGTLYVFQPQIEPLLYPHQLRVKPMAAPTLSADVLLARAATEAPAGSRAVTAIIQTSADRSAEFIFRYPDGEKYSLYLNPYTGEFLGTLSVSRRFMQIDRMIHRQLLLGKPGELLMELAACWTLVMIGTGIALWWPRGAWTWRGTFWPRFALRRRPFWKNVHAVMGIWLAVGGLAFILSGLPWSGSWGKNFKALATQLQPGAPRGAWSGTALQSSRSQAVTTQAITTDHTHHTDSSLTVDALALPQTAWAVGARAVPETTAPTSMSPISLASVLAIADRHGINTDFSIALPNGPTGVYTVSYFPGDPQQERLLHIDQYSGHVLQTIAYQDYNTVSRIVSYGTSLHMGRYFGVANQLLAALISLGLAAMVITGTVMWWQRRPAKSLGAPARLPHVITLRGWKIGLVTLGIIFPLMGATMLFVWLLDKSLIQRRHARAS